jgi:hypothetical protein
MICFFENFTGVSKAKRAAEWLDEWLKEKMY